MKLHDVIRLAYEKGYRATDDGKIIGLRGKELVLKLRGNQRYPTFPINVGNLTKSGVYGIPAHKFAAYCFYGEEAFKPGIVVRHLNGNTLDISRKNIALGTYSDNEADKPKEVKTRVAKIARAAQGRRPFNAKLTDDQVRFIRARTDLNGQQLADMFGVTRTTIADIRKGKKYADVK